MTSDLPESGILGSLKWGITCLGAPGVVVSLVMAGNVHFVTLWVINAVNVVVYSGLVYFLLTLRARRKREP
jgi:Flp pilus assembly protein TadB